MKKRVFSGIQPSGNLHIGNYLGAIRNWVNDQETYDNIFCVVDQHAITVPYDPSSLKNNVRKVIGLYLAAGLDPEKCTLFVQSHIPEHTELAWLLTCYADSHGNSNRGPIIPIYPRMIRHSESQ